MRKVELKVQLFTRYLIMYGPSDSKTGVRGIRSDAPEEAKQAFFLWYRNRNRYENGRIMGSDDIRLKKLIIDVNEEPNKGIDKPLPDYKDIVECMIA